MVQVPLPPLLPPGELPSTVVVPAAVPALPPGLPATAAAAPLEGPAKRLALPLTVSTPWLPLPLLVLVLVLERGGRQVVNTSSCSLPQATSSTTSPATALTCRPTVRLWVSPWPSWPYLPGGMEQGEGEVGGGGYVRW
jgi:hypothetical protein